MKSQLEQICNSFAEMSEDFQNNRQEMEKRQNKIQEINKKGAIPETTYRLLNNMLITKSKIRFII